MELWDFKRFKTCSIIFTPESGLAVDDPDSINFRLNVDF